MGLLESVGQLLSPPNPEHERMYQEMQHSQSSALFQQWVSQQFSILSSKIAALEEQLREHLGGEE